MLTTSHLAKAVAGIGGLLWTVKAVVITARDGSFDPLEGFFFIGGLLALLVACLLVAFTLTARLGGLARAAATAGAAIGLVAGTLAITELGKALAAGVAPGGNLGLEEEGGILLAGVMWMVVAARISTSRGTVRAPRGGDGGGILIV